MPILLIIYMILGLWALNKVWYSKRVYLVRDSLLFNAKKFMIALLLGWILIPIALVLKILGK